MSARHTKDFDWDTLKGSHQESHYLGGIVKCHQSWFQKYIENQRVKVSSTETNQQLKSNSNTQHSNTNLPYGSELKKEDKQRNTSIKDHSFGFKKLIQPEKENKKPKKSNETKDIAKSKRDVVTKKLHFKK